MTRLERIPAIRAALRLPPTAIVCRPKVVRLSSTQPATVTARKTRAGTGTPSTRPAPTRGRMASCLREMGVLSLIQSARPRAMVSMARVAMKGTTRPQVMARPLIAPRSTAKPIVPSMNIQEPFSNTSPPAMLAAASTDPTDRSIPPVAITKVMPMAMMPVMLAWVSTFSRLSLVGKTSGLMITPATSRATITTGSTSSWTGTWRQPARALRAGVSTAISSPCLGGVVNGDRGSEHVFLGAGGAVELVDDVALTHHEHAVTEAEELGQLAGDHDDSDPVGRQLGDHPVDLRAGADVDASGRFVQQQDPAGAQQPAGQDRLLLVAAGELARRPLGRVGPGLERPEVAGGFLSLAGAIGERPAPESGQVGDRCVADHAPVQPQPLGLALLGREPEAGPDGQVGPAGREAATADLHLAGLGRVQPIDQAEQLGAAPSRPARPGRGSRPRADRMRRRGRRGHGSGRAPGARSPRGVACGRGTASPCARRPCARSGCRPG